MNHYYLKGKFSQNKEKEEGGGLFHLGWGVGFLI
jgi:hypothetical protein